MLENCLFYKGYPLVRCKNEIYYGFMSDPYVAMITIIKSDDTDGVKMTSKARICLMDTNEKDPMKMVVKNSEKDCGLYEALDTAGVWLAKFLNK